MHVFSTKALFHLTKSAKHQASSTVLNVVLTQAGIPKLQYSLKIAMMPDLDQEM